MKRLTAAAAVVVVAFVSLATVRVDAAEFGWRPRRAGGVVVSAVVDKDNARGPSEEHIIVVNTSTCTPRSEPVVSRTAWWLRTLFECHPHDDPKVIKLDAIPGCNVFFPKSSGGYEELRPYRYLPPHPFPRHRSVAWRHAYASYETWLYDGGAVDGDGEKVREEILFADGATVGKSVLWMSHFITAWAVSKGQMLNEQWTRLKFDNWRW